MCSANECRKGRRLPVYSPRCVRDGPQVPDRALNCRGKRAFEGTPRSLNSSTRWFILLILRSRTLSLAFFWAILSPTLSIRTLSLQNSRSADYRPQRKQRKETYCWYAKSLLCKGLRHRCGIEHPRELLRRHDFERRCQTP